MLSRLFDRVESIRWGRVGAVAMALAIIGCGGSLCMGQDPGGGGGGTTVDISMPQFADYSGTITTIFGTVASVLGVFITGALGLWLLNYFFLKVRSFGKT